jgi:aminoglycoside 6'-N-acetyltransferase
MNEPALRRLGRADFPMLSAWLAQAHVSRWWNHDTRPEALERDFGAVVDGLDRAEVFVACVQARPFGLLQRYTFADNPGYLAELATLVDVPCGALSMDYLVGEASDLRCGLGSAMLQVGVGSAWVAFPTAPAFVVPVGAANTASWRVLERAGFRRVAEGWLKPDNPVDDGRHYVYRIDRPAR